MLMHIADRIGLLPAEASCFGNQSVTAQRPCFCCINSRDAGRAHAGSSPPARAHSVDTELRSNITMEKCRISACAIPRHAHATNFVHVVLEGTARYEIVGEHRTLGLNAAPGTSLILPVGTVDECKWSGSTRRLVAEIHPRFLAHALDEPDAKSGTELALHWNLKDPNIPLLLLAIQQDLDAGSPAGRLYADSLASALAVYLLKRYGATPSVATPIGGLPGYRLRRILDYIDANLGGDLSLSQLGGVVGMSPHYFAEMFRQSTGKAPHQYVLQRRLHRAKHTLLDSKRSIIEAGLDAGFQNPSHFARVFRRFVGTSPSGYRARRRPGGADGLKAVASLRH